MLQDGSLEGVTRNHFCFAIFPDEEASVYVCHRSYPQFPRCAECAAKDIEHVVKDDKSTNSDIHGKWRKRLLLNKGEKDPRLTSTEAKAQRKWVGHVNIQLFLNL